MKWIRNLDDNKYIQTFFFFFLQKNLQKKVKCVYLGIKTQAVSFHTKIFYYQSASWLQCGMQSTSNPTHNIVISY